MHNVRRPHAPHHAVRRPLRDESVALKVRTMYTMALTAQDSRDDH